MRKITNLTLVGLIALLLLATYARNATWYDDLTLWQDIEWKSPNIDRAHFQLGFFFAEHGRIDDAIREYEAVLDIDPTAVGAYNNLGILYEKKGRLTEALAVYQTAIKLDLTMQIPTTASVSSIIRIDLTPKQRRNTKRHCHCNRVMPPRSET